MMEVIASLELERAVSRAKGVELYTVQLHDSQMTLKLLVGATHDQIRTENMLSTSYLLIQLSTSDTCRRDKGA